MFWHCKKKLEMLLIYMNEMLILINVEQSIMIPEGSKLFFTVKSIDFRCMFVMAARTPTSYILLFI